MAVPFFNLPNTLAVAFATSIIPVIATAFSEKNTQAIKSTIESTFRVVSIIAMPCAFGLACMSKPILSLIYPERMSEVVSTAPLLSILGLGVVFVSMMTITNNMLIAQHQEMKTIISMICGMSVKIISSYILIGTPWINKFGTPIGTCLCYLTIMSMNFYFLAKYTKVVPSVRQTFLKPFMAAAVMAICTILSYMLFNKVLNGSRIAVLAALVIAVAVYGVCILAFKTLTRDDILLLPKGANLYEAMKKRKLID
jgi:stage V sporulation protein B